MKPKTFMVIAVEASGDLLAAELVSALREELTRFEAAPTWDYQPLRTSLEPRFFGAGGPHLAAAGVELAFDLTVHSVTGLSDVLKKYFTFRKLFKRLYDLALEREPDAILCVDFSGFNRRFAHAIRRQVNTRGGWFHDWRPKIIQYISPQVWASREERAFQMARDYDLVLSIFPFEKGWYARKTPKLRVEFVGNPVFERYFGSEGSAKRRLANAASHGSAVLNNDERTTRGAVPRPTAPIIILLPGSRPGELERHIPVVLPALDAIRNRYPALRALMVLPNERLAQLARQLGDFKDVEMRVGNLPEALRQADLAIASTGTVLMECACFGVPTVALYKTSWVNFQIG
ncbi:MAG: lipid-A-disaccharide synthase, partial [Limisphaerales bacterium]